MYTCTCTCTCMCTCMCTCTCNMFCVVDERATGEIEECHDVQCGRVKTTSKRQHVHVHVVY